MEKLVDRIINTLLERAGFDNWWYDITEELQNEIKQELLEVLKAGNNDEKI